MLELATRLNSAIKESEEYRRYCETLEAVKRNPEQYQAMNAFRRRNYELQSYDDGVNRFHEINNLGFEFEKVVRDPAIYDFLIAEQMLSRKMTQMYEMIADGLELDYDYME